MMPKRERKCALTSFLLYAYHNNNRKLYSRRKTTYKGRMRVVAQLMSLMMAAPAVMVWAQGHPGRCVADCQAMTSSMGTPCSEFKTGKPFKACGWSHREGVKDACRQLCSGTDRR